MKIVVDTNVIISSIGKLSRNRPIFDGLLRNQFELSISNDIMMEYKEILYKKTNLEVSNNFISLISILKNVEFINIYYKWCLMKIDPDDDKFIDCYVASNSDYLVTDDKHFAVVKQIEFPKINIITSSEFIAILKNYNS